MGRSEEETRRLIEQSQLYDDVTRRFFLRSGIAKGMKVLDIGSGAGDVALTLAEFVGADGHVVGVDLNPDILKTAQNRADAAGFTNVEFIAGDTRTLELPNDFDAVVGRLVLMYMADPADALDIWQHTCDPVELLPFKRSILHLILRRCIQIRPWQTN